MVVREPVPDADALAAGRAVERHRLRLAGRHGAGLAPGRRGDAGAVPIALPDAQVLVDDRVRLLPIVHVERLGADRALDHDPRLPRRRAAPVRLVRAVLEAEPLHRPCQGLHTTRGTPTHLVAPIAPERHVVLLTARRVRAVRADVDELHAASIPGDAAEVGRTQRVRERRQRGRLRTQQAAPAGCVARADSRPADREVAMAVIGRATVVMMIWAVAALLPRAALGDYYTSVSKDQSCGAYTDLNGINYLRCGCGAGMPPFANNGLKKDDQLEICVALYLSDGTHAPEQMVAGSAYYMQFSPLVDELTALSIVNGSNFLTSAFGQAFPGQAPGQNTHVAVNISVQVGPSFPSAPNHALGYAPVDDKRWQVHAGITRAVPYFTIIITLQGGQVTDVSWDDQCAGCMAQTDTCQSGARACVVCRAGLGIGLISVDGRLLYRGCQPVRLGVQLRPDDLRGLGRHRQERADADQLRYRPFAVHQVQHTVVLEQHRVVRRRPTRE